MTLDLPDDITIVNIPIDEESLPGLVVFRLTRKPSQFSGLPHRARLRVKRDTVSEKVTPLPLKAGQVVEYWGEADATGKVLIYKGAFELWVSADDLEKV